MADPFDRLVGPLIQREGGGRFTNDPDDPGGATKFGIDAKTLGAWRGLGRPAAPAEVQALTLDEAMAIYRKTFWTVPGFDQVAAVSEGIAAELFDSAVNVGPELPGRWLQRTLNLCNQRGATFPDLIVDGRIGPVTVDALSKLIQARRGDGEGLVLTCLNGFQFGRYVEITEAGGPNGKLERFFCGWIEQRVGFR